MCLDFGQALTWQYKIIISKFCQCSSERRVSNSREVLSKHAEDVAAFTRKEVSRRDSQNGVVQQVILELVLCVERVHHMSLVHLIFTMVCRVAKALWPQLSSIVKSLIDRSSHFPNAFTSVIRVHRGFD